MAAQTWHFKDDGEVEVPHFASRIVRTVAYKDADGRVILSGQPIRVLAIEVPDRSERTLEQYQAVKAAVKGLAQIFPERVF